MNHTLRHLNLAFFPLLFLALLVVALCGCIAPSREQSTDQRSTAETDSTNTVTSGGDTTIKQNTKIDQPSSSTSTQNDPWPIIVTVLVAQLGSFALIAYSIYWFSYRREKPRYEAAKEGNGNSIAKVR